MIVTRLVLKNWRNFRDADVNLTERTYLLGANATGKSNFLDVFRFLRDISKVRGGGLQKAIIDRGGISKLRCLHARRDPEVSIEVELSEGMEDTSPTWRYIIAFKPEGKGQQRTLISREEVWRKQKGETWLKKHCILARPNNDDKKDIAQLTQTHLEQIQSNAEFREIANTFNEVTYLHLVPQLLKYGDSIGGQKLEDDPFGQGFLESIAKASIKTRDSRLRKIAKALEHAVPQFKELRFEPNKVNGRPHLEARYVHHRPHAGWQREEHFSDGTLRLIGLLWSLLDGDSLLLLEEPELSLNDAIVKEIPLMLQRAQKDRKKRRQIIISTHSEALLSNPGIDGRGVLLLEPGPNGTEIRAINEEERHALMAGLSVADVMLRKTHPSAADKLAQW